MDGQRQRQRTDERGWVLPASLLTVIVVGALLDLRCAPTTTPNEAAREWLTREVTGAVAAEDLVIVAPPQAADDVAAALGRPVHAGYPAGPPSPLDGAERTLWFIARDGAQLPRGDVWADFVAVSSHEHEGWVLTRLAPRDATPAAPVAFDFWAALDAATAAVVRDGREHACAPVAEARRRCGSERWNFVGRYVAAFEGDGARRTPRRCIWAHPVAEGVLTIRFPAVPLPPGATLRGGAGIVAGTPDGAGIDVRVLVDGVRRTRVAVPGKGGSWRPFTARLGGLAEESAPGDESVASVTFEIETDDNRWRLLCLDAVVTAPAPERRP